MLIPFIIGLAIGYVTGEIKKAIVVSIILEWFFSHKEYDRRFGYS